IRETRSGDDDAVVNIARTRNDRASLRIDGHCFGRIIEARVEDVVVAPEHVIRLEDGLAHSELDLEFLRDLPRILGEELEHVASRDGVIARTDFGVRTEAAESKVRDSGIQ